MAHSNSRLGCKLETMGSDGQPRRRCKRLVELMESVNQRSSELQIALGLSKMRYLSVPTSKFGVLLRRQLRGGRSNTAPKPYPIVISRVTSSEKQIPLKLLVKTSKCKTKEGIDGHQVGTERAALTIQRQMPATVSASRFLGEFFNLSNVMLDCRSYRTQVGPKFWREPPRRHVELCGSFLCESVGIWFSTERPTSFWF